MPRSRPACTPAFPLSRWQRPSESLILRCSTAFCLLALASLPALSAPDVARAEDRVQLAWTTGYRDTMAEWGRWDEKPGNPLAATPVEESQEQEQRQKPDQTSWTLKPARPLALAGGEPARTALPGPEEAMTSEPIATDIVENEADSSGNGGKLPVARPIAADSDADSDPDAAETDTETSTETAGEISLTETVPATPIPALPSLVEGEQNSSARSGTPASPPLPASKPAGLSPDPDKQPARTESDSPTPPDRPAIIADGFPPLPPRKPAPPAPPASWIEPSRIPLAECHAELKRLGFRFEVAGDLYRPSGCGYQGGVKLTGSRAAYSMPITVNCETALTWARFQAKVIQGEAVRLLGQRVKKIHVAGSYQCRTVNHKPGAKLSRHARGSAIDIGAFILEDGKTISVTRNWRDKDAGGRFLRSIGKKACQSFDTVLTPDDDQYHQTHIHFDLGSRGLC